ncbi:serine hydrolase domain-containing protein [Streptomyces chartreusis]
MIIDEKEWQQRLEALIAKHDVPAAAVAVVRGNDRSSFAAGVLNRATGVEATTDSIFQIGSVTKTYTASLILKLVDDGLLHLDRPIAADMPELRLADPDVLSRLTLRHLLTHTSGIDGDHFADLGRGEDVLERYVGTCGELEQVLPLGAAWAYCNTGYAIAGRAVERATGLPFDQAMRERLLAPLGADNSHLLPEDVLRYRVAFGHVPGPDGLTLAPVPITPRTMAPAGAIMATADDVLDFVQLYLDGGVTRDGERLLSASMVASAWQPHITVPDPSVGTHWGLGWMITEWDGHRVIGHDGGTVGQGAFVRVLPEAGVAVVLLGNGPGVGELMPDVMGALIGELCGARPPLPYRPAQPIQGEVPDWLGVYERVNMRVSLCADVDGLKAEVGIGGLAAESLGSSLLSGRLERAADGTYITDAVGEWMPVVPFTLPDGTPCLHFGGRALRRRDDRVG